MGTQAGLIVVQFRVQLEGIVFEVRLPSLHNAGFEEEMQVQKTWIGETAPRRCNRLQDAQAFQTDPSPRDGSLMQVR